MYAIYIIAVFSRSLLLIEIISKSSVDWSRCVIIHASLLIPTRSPVWTVIRCVLVMVQCQILKIDTIPARHFTTETSFETQRTSVVPHRVPSYCGAQAYSNFRLSPLCFFLKNLATFFCSSLSLSLSLFIAFTRVSPPLGCHPTPFFTCPTSFLHYSL